MSKRKLGVGVVRTREVRMSDERARFLEEESEERIEQDCLAGEIAA
jgi:hypothetical protein